MEQREQTKLEMENLNAYMERNKSRLRVRPELVAKVFDIIGEQVENMGLTQFEIGAVLASMNNPHVQESIGIIAQAMIRGDLCECAECRSRRALGETKGSA